MQEPLNEKVLVLEKVLVECGCRKNHDESSEGGVRTFGIEMQPCLFEAHAEAPPESLKVDEVAEEATESLISIATLS